MSIIQRPIISEKANHDSELSNRYWFYVDPRSNKHQIVQAIKDLYGVDVENIRTMIVAPEVKTKYTKNGLQVAKSDKLKKAIVDIKEGQVIDVYSI